jgi:hypothetical protein
MAWWDRILVVIDEGRTLFYGGKRMETRNDVHAPSRINPADYEYVAQEHVKSEGFGGCFFMLQERKVFEMHKAKTGGNWSHHAHGGNCMICGSVNALYTVIYYHAPTNSYIRTGQDCASKFDTEHADAFRIFREASLAATHAKAGKAKAQGLLNERGLGAAWTIYTLMEELNPEGPRVPWEETTITNIVGKLVKYGSASDKQFDFVGVLLGKINNRAALAAKKAADTAHIKDCPEGRIVIRGRVLTVKHQESAFNVDGIYKMLVQHGDGWKVWGSVPSALNVGRGDVVEFKGTVERSKDDPKFGFFKRPACASVVEAAPAPVAAAVVEGVSSNG